MAITFMYVMDSIILLYISGIIIEVLLFFFSFIYFFLLVIETNIWYRSRHLSIMDEDTWYQFILLSYFIFNFFILFIFILSLLNLYKLIIYICMYICTLYRCGNEINLNPSKKFIIRSVCLLLCFIFYLFFLSTLKIV